jgi:hypothetical protein
MHFISKVSLTTTTKYGVLSRSEKRCTGVREHRVSTNLASRHLLITCFNLFFRLSRCFNSHLGLSCLVGECWRILVHFLLQPSYHPSCCPPRCHSIGIPHKRLHVLISHQFHNSRMDLVQFSRVNRQNLILDGSDIRVAVLNCCTLTWSI